jgi:hypothetical protein
MQKRFLSIVTTWPFLVSLAVLVLNDWWLKGACPGAITGKLSDFAGIAVVSMLLLAAYPRHTLSIFCGVSISFLWWKSPASEPFLQFFNQLGLYRIGRTVDYTDMMAMIIFPACRAAVARKTRFSIPCPRIRRYLAIPAATITIAAILGTSSIPTRQNFVVRNISAAEELRRDEVEDVIRWVAAKHGLKHSERAHTSEVMILSGNDMTLTYSFPTVNSVSISVTTHSNGIIEFPWSTTADEKTDALGIALKKNLASRFQGLEYIEPLVPR